MTNEEQEQFELGSLAEYFGIGNHVLSTSRLTLLDDLLLDLAHDQVDVLCR